MTGWLLRLSDKTLFLFALIASAVLSLLAVGSVIRSSDGPLAFASLDRPLPTDSRLETTDALGAVEGLGIFEEAIQREAELRGDANGESSPTSGGPEAVEDLPDLSAIVMQDDRITAFAFKDGVVMRFQEGDIVSGRTIVRLSLSEITFRDEAGEDETLVLFGTNVAPSEDAGL